MEVEAVDEGVVEDILVAEGTEGVKVNTPIAQAGRGGGSAPHRRPRPRLRLPAAKPPEPVATPSRRSARLRRLRRRLPRQRGRREGERIFASPLARRIAGQNGRRPGLGRRAPARTGGSSRPTSRLRSPVRPRLPRLRPPPAASAPAAPRQVQSPGPDGHPGRQLRPDPAGRHAQDHRPADDRQLPRRAALPADHRHRDRRPAGRAGQDQRHAGEAGRQGHASTTSSSRPPPWR